MAAKKQICPAKGGAVALWLPEVAEERNLCHSWCHDNGKGKTHRDFCPTKGRQHGEAEMSMIQFILQTSPFLLAAVPGPQRAPSWGRQQELQNSLQDTGTPARTAAADSSQQPDVG